MQLITICYKVTIIIFIVGYSISSIISLINLSTDKISIIIPSYNREHFIIRSINSVLNQSYQNIEVILIDDGSTDNTKNEISQIKDKRFRYIKLRKNKGANVARNIGIKKAIGKYIAFQDSDDFFHSDKLEKQINNLRKFKSDFDFCKICIHINSTFKQIIPDENQEHNFLKNAIVNELCNGNFISTQSILVKKSYIKKNLFDPQFPRFQDYDLALRIMPKLKVSYTREVLVDLYRHNDSISHSDKSYQKGMELLIKKKYRIKCNIENKLYYMFKNSK
jgi:glycosyltransferase involved in cell wall biosynthesis